MGTFENNSKIQTTEWNNALGYLETIDWLLRTAHIQSMDDGDVYDWFMALEQVSIEVSGQYMTQEEEKIVTEIEDLRKKTLEKFVKEKQVLNNLNNAAKELKLMKLREVIRPFHLLVNKYAHLKGLRMPKKQTTNIDEMV